MARLATAQSATASQLRLQPECADTSGRLIPSQEHKMESATASPKKQRSLKSTMTDSFLLRPLDEESLLFPETQKKERLVSTKRSPVKPTPYRRTQGPSFSLDISPEESMIGAPNQSWRPRIEIALDSDSDDDSLYASGLGRPVARRTSKNITLERQDGVDFASPAKTGSSRPNTILPLRSISGNRRTSISSVEDSLATIRFSPPRSTRPSKAIPQLHPRDRTPSPPPSPTRGKLMSPKKAATIPPTPHRPSIDAFWNPEVVNAWNDEYSPKKILKSPRKIPLPDSSDDEADFTPTTSPRKSASPAKKDRAKVAAKKEFDATKHATAQAFLDELEAELGKGEVQSLAASTGGVRIIWSKKLNTTGGRAHWKREETKTKSPDGTKTVTTKHFASIELAEKVVSDEHRLLNVLAHEYCHLLNFMISGVRDKPHGASFQAWASRASKAFAHRGVEVTTRHDYAIEYRYAWGCTGSGENVDAGCGNEYERHSKSIDPTRYRCGKCKGTLVQIRPAPRGRGKGDAKGKGADGAAEGSEYQKFVREEYAKVKSDLGGKSPMKDVMKEVAARYRVRKEEKAAAGVQAPESVNAEAADALDLDDTLDTQDLVEVPSENEDEDSEQADEQLDSVARQLDFLTLAGEA